MTRSGVVYYFCVEDNSLCVSRAAPVMRVLFFGCVSIQLSSSN